MSDQFELFQSDVQDTDGSTEHAQQQGEQYEEDHINEVNDVLQLTQDEYTDIIRIHYMSGHRETADHESMKSIIGTDPLVISSLEIAHDKKLEQQSLIDEWMLDSSNDDRIVNEDYLAGRYKV